MLKITRCIGESFIIGDSLKVTVVRINKTDRARDTVVELELEEIPKKNRAKGDQNGD